MPTTFDNQTALFALFVLILFAGIGMLIRRPSVKASRQRQQEEWAQTGGAPEHTLIDDHASTSANVLCFLLCVMGAYLTCSVLFGNILWVSTLLGGK